MEEYLGVGVDLFACDDAGFGAEKSASAVGGIGDQGVGGDSAFGVVVHDHAVGDFDGVVAFGFGGCAGNFVDHFPQESGGVA